MRKAFLISSCVFLLLSCGQSGLHERGCSESAISRLLERAIEVGEKYLADDDLIENIALTEGTDAAVKLYEELHHHEDYAAFWECLKQADSICSQIPDSLSRQVIVTHMKLFISRIATLAEDMRP